MRKSLCVLAATCFVFGGARLVRADDQAAARAIVDKAIKAIGGEAKLEKHKAVTWNESGTYYGMGDGLPYTGKYAVQWPHQFRMEIEGVFAIVLNGDKGWIKDATGSRDMTEQELTHQKADHYVGWVTTLVPLKDKAFTLATIDETKVDDRPAVGVKVSRKDHRDVKLYFDKATGLLVKSESRSTSPEQEFKEVDQEIYYRDYKDIDGVKVSTKVAIKRDGKMFVEAESHELKAVGKLDNSVFDKP